MVKKLKRDDRQRYWRSVLRELVRRNPPTFTAADLEKFGLERTQASQLLGRLSRYGSVRKVGFESAEGGVGRRRIVYEITKKGERDAEYEPEE